MRSTHRSLPSRTRAGFFIKAFESSSIRFPQQFSILPCLGTADLSERGLSELFPKPKPAFIAEEPAKDADFK
jgi:hypothetical protein